MSKKFINLSVAALVVAFVLVFISNKTAFAESRLPFTNLPQFFTFPLDVKENWFTRQVINLPERGVSGFIFGHKTIIDDAGLKISPSASFIFEQVNDKLGAIEYSAQARAKSRIPITIDEVYIAKDGLFPWKQAIGYKARYMDTDGLEHTLYLVHGIFSDSGKAYGVQVIMDSTTSVLPIVEPEFMAMLANIGRGQ